MSGSFIGRLVSAMHLINMFVQPYSDIGRKALFKSEKPCPLLVLCVRKGIKETMNKKVFEICLCGHRASTALLALGTGIIMRL